VEAMTLGDRIVVLSGGRIQQVGRPIDLYRAPVNRFVAGFIGTPPMNFIEGRVQIDHGAARFVTEGLGITLPRERFTTLAPVPSATLGVRPEDLIVVPSRGSSADDAVAGRVVLVEMLGGTSHVHFDAGPHRLLASVADDLLPRVGDTIAVRARTDRVHLFDGEGRTLR
ncbi:MAG: TOBE domain-containing protein, partial [Gemmatimonadaceae bacterium]